MQKKQHLFEDQMKTTATTRFESSGKSGKMGTVVATNIT